MTAAPHSFDTSPAPIYAQAVPFATSHVTLTKQEHIQLVMQANGWKGLHQRAVERAQWRDQRYRRVLRQLKDQAAQREAKLCAELELGAGEDPRSSAARVRPQERARWLATITLAGGVPQASMGADG